SLLTTAPSESSQFTHSLSLLSSKTDSQRKESLSHLATAVASRPVDSPLPRPVGVILPTLFPLILDGNNGVRTQLLKLLKVLPQADLEGHASAFLPYIRAGMTHLAADIRLSSVEILSWLLSIAGQEVVSAAGGWIKTLNCFLSLLGWHSEASTKWSSNRATFGKSGSEGKLIARILQVFAEFLRTGIGPSDDPNATGEGQGVTDGAVSFPLRQTQYHLLPTKASPFAYLDLFSNVKNEEGDMYESREDRLRVFAQLFQLPVERGIDAARQEGGESGRASAGVRKILRECNVAPKP
ncbi:rRNA processing protein, partial [Arthroderma sp. PD_2]